MSGDAAAWQPGDRVGLAMLAARGLATREPFPPEPTCPGRTLTLPSSRRCYWCGRVMRAGTVARTWTDVAAHPACDDEARA